MTPSDPDTPSPKDGASDLVSLPDRSPETLAAFAREHPRAAIRAFEALSPEERVRIVTQARGRDRYDLILLSHDAQAIVQALSPADLLVTIKDIDDDAPGLVRFASTDQVKLFIDLDAWKGDLLDLDGFEEWLGLLHESGNKLNESILELDREILILWLGARVRVIMAEPDGELPPGTPAAVMTLDGVYYLEPLRPQDDLALVRAALLSARTQDERLYRSLLEGVLRELPAELESWGFRWRESRLNDEGFPALDDAVAVYARLDPGKFDPARHLKGAGVTTLQTDDHPAGIGKTLVRPQAHEGSLLLRAWEEGVRQGDWERVEEEAAGLLNRVLVADRADWNSPARTRELFERAGATLNLGVEAALEDEPEGSRLEAAVRLLRETQLIAIFRLGFSRTLQVRDVAMQAAPEDDEEWIAILDPPLPDAITGARGIRPLFWTGLLGESEPTYRAFRTLEEVQIARRAMILAAALRSLWKELVKRAVAGSLGEGSVRSSGLRLSALVNTAFACQALEGEAVLRPLPVARLGDLQGCIFNQSGPGCDAPILKEEVPDQFRTAWESWLALLDASARPLVETYLDECLALLRTEIGVLDPDDVDPRGISAILLQNG